MKPQKVFMKSTYKLIWSDEAFEGLKEIFVYIELNFSEKDVENFAQKFDKHLELIRLNPEIFPFSAKSKTVRRCVFAKLTSVYYTFSDDTVKLITIKDNRKHPPILPIK